MKRSISIWPFRHLWLKVLSLAVALLLWMVVSGEETVERVLRVPLELQQLPSGLELESELPALVDVRVRGGSSTLSHLAAGDVVVVLDVHAARPGQRLFQMASDEVRAPFGVQVIQLSPSSVPMVFERTATKEVPVTPSIEGIPAAGFAIGKVTSDPPTVEVVGPETAIQNVAEATTEPVSVEGAREPVSERVTVGLFDPTLRVKDARPASVHVEIVAAANGPERGRPRRGGGR